MKKEIIIKAIIILIVFLYGFGLGCIITEYFNCKKENVMLK